MIKEWNEFLIEKILTLKKQPKSLTFSSKIADNYYDYMNDVIYIDEAKEPNEESKKELSYVMTKYLKNGRVKSLHQSFEELYYRMGQTELYKPIGLWEIVKNCRIKEAKEHNKVMSEGFGMERVARLKEMKRQKKEAKRKQNEKKKEKENRLKKREKEKRENKKPKKNDNLN